MSLKENPYLDIVREVRKVRSGVEVESYNVDESEWSGDVDTHWHSEEGLFKKSAKEVAVLLKRASSSLKQAMSRLNFYINRAGSNLSVKDKKRLDNAKIELRKLYGGEKKTASVAMHRAFVLSEKTIGEAEVIKGTVYVSASTSSTLGTLASLYFYDMEDYASVESVLKELGIVGGQRRVNTPGVFIQLTMYEDFEDEHAAFSEIEAAVGDSLLTIPLNVVTRKTAGFVRKN